MAILFDAAVSPDALTTFVREVPTPSALALSSLFPTRFVDDNAVDWQEVNATNRTARFRSYDGRIHVSERDAGSTRKVALPPLSSSLSLGEYERLQLEFARTQGTNQGALANAIYNDGERLTREVQNRMEMAWGDVLTDGILSINENGLVSTADFGVPSSHKITAGTLWTVTGSGAADIFSQLQAAVDVYVETNGFPPGSILASTRVRRLAQINPSLINAVAGSAAGRTRVSITEINDVLIGEGLPYFREPYDTRLDVDGTSTRAIADDRVVLLPPDVADLGYTAYGVSATALELVGSNQSELDFEDAAGIVGVVEKAGPPYREFTFVDAVGMPILSNAKLLMILDVA